MLRLLCQRPGGLLAAVVIAVLTGPAAAVPIPLFNTGVDNSSNNLALGSVDPHWVLSSAPSGGPNAWVQSPRPGSWVANTSDSQWIGPGVDALTSFAGGTYVYDQTFDLTGFDATTAVITGSWASDNQSTIFLNGVSTGMTHAGGSTAFTAFDTFLLNSGFLPGVNTLTIQVTNGSGPTGLHVDALQGTVQPIPEPLSLVLLLLAGSMLIAVRR